MRILIPKTPDERQIFKIKKVIPTISEANSIAYPTLSLKILRKIL